MANLFAQLAPRKGSHPKNPFGAEDAPTQRRALRVGAVRLRAASGGAPRRSRVRRDARERGCGKAGGDPGAYRAAVELRGGAPGVPRRALPLRAEARPEVNPGVPPVLLCA